LDEDKIEILFATVFTWHHHSFSV